MSLLFKPFILNVLLCNRHGWRKRHSQVGTDNVNYRLPMSRVVLSKTFQCIEAAKPNGRLLTAKLFGRAYVKLSERFSSSDLAGLEDVYGLGQLPGLPRAAAEFAQDAPGFELGVGAFAGAA